ncbi:MAG: hypothetical protein ACUVQH_06810 [Thermogutta sp.]
MSQADSGAASGESVRRDVDAPALFQPHYDSWEIDQDLAQLKRFLAEEYLTGRVATRFEFPHLSAPPNHLEKALPRKEVIASSSAGSVDEGTAWWLFLCGTTVFGCGAILLGWGLGLDQPRLSSWGIPISVIGLLFFIAAILFAVRERSAARQPATTAGREVAAHVTTAHPKADRL